MKRIVVCLLLTSLLISALPSARAAGFSDVPADAWYAEAVAWALDHGVTTGTEPGLFSPDAVCTRAQIVTFLWRTAGCPAVEADDRPFTDAEDGYFADAVLWAAAQGIAKGIAANCFAPYQPCTRAHVVTFLWRAAGCPAPVLTECPFSDVPADYYRDAVLWAVEHGITTGTAAGRFSPNAACTRAQIVTFLYRAVASGTLFAPATDYRGYTAAVDYGSGFLAVGTGGRLDVIEADGSVTRLDSGTDADLMDVWTDGSRVLVSCADGSVLYSTDGVHFAAHRVSDSPLCGAVRYRGKTYAAACDGMILQSSDLEVWDPVNDEAPFGLTHLAALNYGLAAINAETDVLFSPDGLNWTHQNFNEVYKGLYSTYEFHALVGAGDTFFVLGCEQDNPNIPLILYTEQMEVWMPIGLNMIDDEVPDYGTPLWRVNDLCFHPDQILAVCEGGRLLAIPGCSVCNRSLPLKDAGSLRCIALNENSVLAAGEDFFSAVVSVLELRQDHIRAEQAQRDVQERGAVVIDVREQRERDQSGWIPGSLHIPLGQLTEKLPELVPDTEAELIFYCASGKRAQTALETAIGLGYYYVYNLGGLKDWPYEVEH